MTIEDFILKLQAYPPKLQVTIRGAKDCNNIIHMEPCKASTCKRMSTHITLYTTE